MIQENKYSTFTALIISVILFICMISSVFLFTNNLVFAESTDAQIVNFNQIVGNQYINGYTFSSGDVSLSNVSLINGHTYYIYDNCSSYTQPYQYFGYISGGSAALKTFTSGGEHYVIETMNATTYGLNIYCNSTTTIDNIIIIDLTEMGIDDYSLQQCKDLFVAPYYSFSVGTPVNLNGLDNFAIGYTQGFNSAWESQNITYNSYMIGAQAFTFSNSVVDNYSNIGYDSTLGAYVFTGVIGIPLGVSIPSGTNITIDFNYYIDDAHEYNNRADLFKLHFGYIDSNNNLIELTSIKAYSSSGSGGRDFYYSGSFNVIQDTDTIYSWVDYAHVGENDSATLIICFSSDMTFRTQNIQAAINSAFTNGQKSISTYYQEGNDGYNQIYHNGYVAGVNSENPYTFSALMSAVIESPLNAVLGIFNFDFMGYNLKNFMTLLLTMCLLLAIVRLFMGSK